MGNYKIVWTEDKKEQAIQMLTDYFLKHGSGECIVQGDSAQFEAIQLMCNISDDVLKDGEGIVYETDLEENE